jgi:hypothetical protein
MGGGSTSGGNSIRRSQPWCAALRRVRMSSRSTQLISRMISVSWASVRSRLPVGQPRLVALPDRPGLVAHERNLVLLLGGPVRDRSYFTAVPSRYRSPLFAKSHSIRRAALLLRSSFQLGQFGLHRSWPWIWQCLSFLHPFCLTSSRGCRYFPPPRRSTGPNRGGADGLVLVFLGCGVGVSPRDSCRRRYDAVPRGSGTVHVPPRPAMVLQLLAANTEHWLASNSTPTYRTPEDTGATVGKPAASWTSHHLQRLGITVGLNRPTSPKITPALTLFADQLTPTRPPSWATPAHDLHHDQLQSPQALADV